VVNEEGVRIKKAKDLLKENGYELIPDVSIKCCQCESTKTVNQSGNYLASDSELHTGCRALYKPHKGSKKVAPKPYYRTYIPYCQECLAKDKDFENTNDVIEVLRLMDKPYIKSIWESTMTTYDENKKEALLGRYCKNLAMNHKDYRFKDSDNWIEVDKHDNEEEDLLYNYNPTDYDIAYWGLGFNSDEYKYLKDSFTHYSQRCEMENQPAMEDLIQQACFEKVELRRNRAKGTDCTKNLKNLQDILTSANIKPKDINAANDPSNIVELGLKIKDIETRRPAEIFGDKSKYYDFDGLQSYFDRFILRPMKNLLTGTRDFDQEFNLRDDE